MSRTPTREKLLDAAQRLMLSKGFTATTVDEICEAASLTKGSFFHYFPTKEDLGKAVLDHYWTTVQDAMRSGAAREARNPLERISGTIASSAELARCSSLPVGCLVGGFAQELSDTHPHIRELCGRYFQQWVLGIMHDLDEAKALYRPDADIDTRSAAEHLVAVVEGSLILAKATRDVGVIERNLRHFERYIRLLLLGESGERRAPAGG